MAQIKPEPTAAISRGVTPPRDERVRSSLKNAEEASRHLDGLHAESACLMPIKKPRKTSPALGSPYLRRDYFFYTTNLNAHSIANAAARILGSISGLINENGELAAHRASRQIDKKMPGVTPRSFDRPSLRKVCLLYTTNRNVESIVAKTEHMFYSKSAGNCSECRKAA